MFLFNLISSDTSAFKKSALLMIILEAIAVTANASTESRRGQLEEVIVVAERREGRLQETPISIAAFTQESLQTIGAYTVEDIGEYTTNLTLQRMPSSNLNMSLTIRGVGAAQPAWNYDGKVGIYLDGVYIGKQAGSIFDVVDLERIEVLRGPQGTLYGKNTTGGAINLVTRKPAGEWAFKQQLTMGDNDRFRSVTSVDFPSFANISSKFTYTKNEYDGWAENDHPRGPEQLGSYDNDSLRVALQWDPSEQFVAEYSYDFSDLSGVAKGAQLTAVNEGYEDLRVILGFLPESPFYDFASDNPFRQMLASGYVQPDDRIDRFSFDNLNDELAEIHMHSLTLTWDLGDVQLKSITSYRDIDSELKPGGIDLDGGSWITPAFHAATIDSDRNDKWHEQYTQEFQIFSNMLDDRIDFTGGIFFHEEEGEQYGNRWGVLIPVPGSALGLPDPLVLVEQNALLGPPPASLGGSYGIDHSSWAAYGQGTWHATDKLDVIVGMRYTEDTKELTSLDSPDRNSNEEDWDEFTWDAALNYFWTDDVSTYAKIATGYSAGGIPSAAYTDEDLGKTADPEFVTDYEFGVKSEWLGNRLRLNAAVFYYDYEDIQITDWQDGATVLTNAGEATLKGLELDIVAVPIEGLTVSASYGYLDFEYDRYDETDPVTGVVTDIASTAVPPFSPEHSANLIVEYAFDPFSFGALTAALMGTYTDGFVFNPKNTTRDNVDSYSLLNARVTLSDMKVLNGQLQVSAWGKNLTDEEYREWGTDFGSLGFAANVFGDPRTWGVDIIYEYR